MRIVTGSSALHQHGINLRKTIKDVDVFVDSPTSARPTDDLIVIPLAIMEMFESDVATPDEVYTIKCSHLGWDEHSVGKSQFGGSKLWDKHKRDVIALSTMCNIKPELYAALTEHWRTVIGNKPYLSLEQKAESFFNDNVAYVYDHDELHRLVAAPNAPLFEKILKDGCEVSVSKAKFDSLTFDEQIRLFHEEITVIAIERYIVHGHPKLFAWTCALKKTVTRLTKNWASDFICSNMRHFIKPRYNLDVV
ncbi:hypothetical protein NVP1081O_063 [Vibrio phage 1.081.O._10N.286.52.C2]|nr:hypothetical protein NVP1081O_063 [Vibrio phage 1.081.O._10N.286.52.C2]